MEEHACDDTRGPATLVGGDVQADVAGSGWNIQYLLKTSSGDCEHIPTQFTCLPGSRCSGSGELVLVRLRPRS